MSLYAIEQHQPHIHFCNRAASTTYSFLVLLNRLVVEKSSTYLPDILTKHGYRFSVRFLYHTVLTICQRQLPWPSTRRPEYGSPALNRCSLCQAPTPLQKSQTSIAGQNRKKRNGLTCLTALKTKPFIFFLGLQFPFWVFFRSVFAGLRLFVPLISSLNPLRNL